MRVLCVDPGGVLGKEAIPVLLPEYGDGFLHVKDADALGDPRLVAAFLDREDDQRGCEAWLLVRSDRARAGAGSADAMRPLAQRLVEILRDTGVEVYVIRLDYLESAPAAVEFMKRGWEGGRYGNFGPDTSTWRQLEFGICYGSDDGAFSEALSGRLNGIATALALRFWQQRHVWAHRWPESRYRVKLKFDRSLLKTELVAIVARWQACTNALSEASTELKNMSVQSRLYPDSAPELIPEEDFHSGDRWGSKPLFVLTGGMADGLGPFSRTGDPFKAKTWVEMMYRGLASAMERARQDVENQFIAGQRKVFEGGTVTSPTTTSTPLRYIHEKEDELERVASASPAQPEFDNLAAMLRRRRRSIVELMNTTRYRPARAIAGGSMATAALVLIAVLTARAELFWGAVMTGGHAVPGWAWYAAGGVALATAFLWGMSRIWRECRVSEAQCLDAFRQDVEAAHRSYKDLLDTRQAELKRMLLSANLALVRAEQRVREVELAQCRYHLDQLGNLKEHFAVPGLELGQKKDSRPGCESVDHRLPENNNDVYFWPATAGPPTVHGFFTCAEPIPNGVDQSIGKALRLAGLLDVEVDCVKSGTADDAGGANA